MNNENPGIFLLADPHYSKFRAAFCVQNCRDAWQKRQRGSPPDSFPPGREGFQMVPWDVREGQSPRRGDPEVRWCETQVSRGFLKRINPKEKVNEAVVA